MVWPIMWSLPPALPLVKFQVSEYCHQIRKLSLRNWRQIAITPWKKRFFFLSGNPFLIGKCIFNYWFLVYIMGKQHLGCEYAVFNSSLWMVKGALSYPDFSLTHKWNIYSGCAFLRCLQPPMHYVILDFSGQGPELWNAPSAGKTLLP